MTRPGARALGRALLAVAGVALIAYLVRGAGPQRVARVLWQAGAWLPVILALEVAQAASDVAALRLLLRERADCIPAAIWVRSSAVAYAMMILLPAGRAAGELARGALFARYLGARGAATAGTQLQAAYLSAIGLASAVEGWAAASSTAAGPLAALLAVNAVLMAGAAAALLAVLWDARVGRWIEGVRRRFAREGAGPEPLDPRTRRRIPWAAAAACAVGRSAQVAQYAVILYAVGGTATARSTLVVHGVHLVGATLGDAVPGQLGVVDATYRAFAGALGFAGAPERALSIAFVAHACQLVMAAACVTVATVIRRASVPAAAAR